MAKKRRPSRQGSDSPEDALSARLLSLGAWARENTQVVVISGIILAIAAAAGLYYYNFQQDVRMQAAEEFERIQQTVVGVGDTQTALTELQTFLDRFGDTPLAPEARLLLAEAHLNEGSPQQAIETLQPVVGNLGPPIAIQAAFLLGSAYEEAGQYGDAEELYLRIADEAELTFQVRNALAAAARMRAESEDYAGAAELYRRILDTYDDQEEAEGTPEGDRATYRLRLAEMEAMADS
ncbi:MAG: tetratricopeptide repeat protein [Gemmatimonadota bacterium]